VIIEMGLALVLAQADPRSAFVAAYIARHREVTCGTHWVDNPTHVACLAMLRREAELEWARHAAPAAQP
jgi:hypothetical protein